jgi:SAM-dependent methyltransferase
VPLARDGRYVVALDQSAAMLARLGERVARLPPAVAARITPVSGDLRSFAVGGRFPLVIAAFNVLEHLYTRGEVAACLERVAAHLTPDGAFVFDVQLPDLAWLLRDPTKRWAKTRFTDPTTGRAMYYSTNHDYDPVSQIALIRLYYEAADEPQAGFPAGRGAPAGVQRPQHPQRHAVLGIVERGDEHRPVGDVEVRVARRQPLPVEVERSRHREGDDLDLRSILEQHALEALAVFRERAVVRVA